MTKIKFGHLQVNEIRNSSAILSGKNSPTGWKSIGKKSEGFGNINGDFNRVVKNINITKKNKQLFS
jgi:hypothetical protein